MKRIILTALVALTAIAACSGGDDGVESGNSSSSLAIETSSSSSFASSSSQIPSNISSSSSENQSSSSSEAEASSSSYGLSSSSSQCSGYGNGTFIDARDNIEYKYVTICTQTWMAENLNRIVDGSRCYDNNIENCKKYGRLYNNETAQTVCPEDWHLPSREEWGMLFNFVGYSEGVKLKATSGWDDFNEQSGNGEDTYGFAALPGGNSTGVSYIYFYEIGKRGYWWSSTRYNIGEFYFFSMRYSGDGVGSSFSDSFFSIRCVKNLH